MADDAGPPSGVSRATEREGGFAQLSGGAERVSVRIMSLRERGRCDVTVGKSLGERIMVPDYGCALWRMVFENLNPTLMTRLQDIVERAILNWEPRIIVNSVVAEAAAEAAGLVHINVDYTIRATNTRSNFVYPFYLREATLAPPGVVA